MSSKIIRLTVQNLLRVKAAEVTPDGARVIVAGRNDQGKSSLLNCIAIALSGKNLPVKPIRDGASSGQVILETEQLIITRKFSQAGGGQLVVHDKEGAAVSSPQTKLDALYSLTTFDPLTFSRQEPSAQAATLRQLTGLDFSDLRKEHDFLFAERTACGRNLREQQGKLTGIPRNPNAPEELVEVSALATELQRALQHNAEHDVQTNRLSETNDMIDAAEMRIRDLEKSLAAAKTGLASGIALREEIKARIAGFEPIDTEAIAARISNAEAMNIAVRENKRWTEEQRKLTELQSAYDSFTAKLDALQEEQKKRTAAAKFPVEGLGFDESGVTFEGHPMKQVSSSKQIRVSLAIACALNPNLRVMLIRDGSLLDKDSLELVRTYAEQHDAQVFMECVGDREDATVIIEDGTVAATPAADAKRKREHKNK